jgi:hypothetical protein
MLLQLAESASSHLGVIVGAVALIFAVIIIGRLASRKAAGTPQSRQLVFWVISVIGIIATVIFILYRVQHG